MLPFSDWLCSCIGPVVAEAMFVNREEIPVYPIYRDPVSCFNKPHMSVFSTWRGLAIRITTRSLICQFRFMILDFSVMILLQYNSWAMKRFPLLQMLLVLDWKLELLVMIVERRYTQIIFVEIRIIDNIWYASLSVSYSMLFTVSLNLIQVSILSGTIAHLDRDAPHYKKYALHHISLCEVRNSRWC